MNVPEAIYQRVNQLDKAQQNDLLRLSWAKDNIWKEYLTETGLDSAGQYTPTRQIKEVSRAGRLITDSSVYFAYGVFGTRKAAGGILTYDPYPTPLTLAETLHHIKDMGGTATEFLREFPDSYAYKQANIQFLERFLKADSSVPKHEKEKLAAELSQEKQAFNQLAGYRNRAEDLASRHILDGERAGLPERVYQDYQDVVEVTLMHLEAITPESLNAPFRRLYYLRRAAVLATEGSLQTGDRLNSIRAQIIQEFLPSEFLNVERETVSARIRKLQTKVNVLEDINGEDFLGYLAGLLDRVLLRDLDPEARLGKTEFSPAKLREEAEEIYWHAWLAGYTPREEEYLKGKLQEILKRAEKVKLPYWRRIL